MLPLTERIGLRYCISAVRCGRMAAIMPNVQGEVRTQSYRRFTLTSGIQTTILRQILTSIRTIWGRRRPRLVGTDVHGNRYFETPPNKASEHVRRSTQPQRFLLVPGQKTVEDSWLLLDGSLPKVPSEWEAWLRHRRSEPPSEFEIAANALAAERTRGLAEKLEIKYANERAEMIRQGLLHDREAQSTDSYLHTSKTQAKSFPTLSDLESVPGAGRKDK